MPGPDDFGGAFGGAGGVVGGIFGSGLNAIGSALRGGPGFSNSRFLRNFATQVAQALRANRSPPGTVQGTPNVPAPYVPPAYPAPYIPPTQPGLPGGPISASAWQAIIEAAREDSARLLADTEAQKAKRAAEKAKKRAAKKAANEARQKKIDEQKKRAEAILAKRAQVVVPRGGSRGAVGRGRAPWEPKVNGPSSPPGGGAAASSPPITVVVNIPGPTSSSSSTGKAGPKEGKLERIRVTARYKRLPNRPVKIATVPKGRTIPGTSVPFPKLSKLLSIGSLVTPFLGFLTPTNAKGRPRRTDPLTPPLTGSQQQVVPYAAASSALGFSTPTKSKTCECKPKKRKKGPKRRRSICYRGTYIETPTGTRKRKREQIPCEAAA